MDTIRYEYLIHHLLINKHQVLLVGSVGTGKTTIADNVLNKLDSSIFNTLCIHMSAQVDFNYNYSHRIFFFFLFFEIL